MATAGGTTYDVTVDVRVEGGAAGTLGEALAATLEGPLEDPTIAEHPRAGIVSVACGVRARSADAALRRVEQAVAGALAARGTRVAEVVALHAEVVHDEEPVEPSPS